MVLLLFLDKLLVIFVRLNMLVSLCASTVLQMSSGAMSVASSRTSTAPLWLLFSLLLLKCVILRVVYSLVDCPGSFFCWQLSWELFCHVCCCRLFLPAGCSHSDRSIPYFYISFSLVSHSGWPLFLQRNWWSQLYLQNGISLLIVFIKLVPMSRWRYLLHYLSTVRHRWRSYSFHSHGMCFFPPSLFSSSQWNLLSLLLYRFFLMSSMPSSTTRFAMSKFLQRYNSINTVSFCIGCFLD